MSDDLAEFKKELRLQQLKENTIEQYSRAIKRYHEEQGPFLTRKGADNWLSKHNHIVNRAAIKKYAQHQETNITVRKVKPKPRKLPEQLSKKEIQRIIQEIDEDYKLITELIAETGMRIGEAVRVKVEHISHEQGQIRLPTTKSTPRVVYPSPELLKRLEANSRRTVDNTKGWCFPSKHGSKSGHIHENTVRHHMKQVAANAKPHSLRHSFATKLLEQGVDLVTTRDLLGHKDISTTSIYTRVVQPRAREAAKHNWLPTTQGVEEAVQTNHPVIHEPTEEQENEDDVFGGL